MTTVEERAEARTAALNRLRRRVDSGLIVDRSSTDAGRNDRFEFVMDVITVSGAWLKEHGLLANKLVYGMDSAGYERMRALGITRLIVDEGVPVIGR